jgi:hypothetical protein
MNEAICKCPTCKEPIDICPYCRDYKPQSNKLCQECFDLFQAEGEALDAHFRNLVKDLNDKFNLLKQPETIMEKLEDLKGRFEKNIEQLGDL